MSDPLADSTAHLERLVRQVMDEIDPVKYDDLASEIWEVLDERERLLGSQLPPPKQAW